MVCREFFFKENFEEKKTILLKKGDTFYGRRPQFGGPEIYKIHVIAAIERPGRQTLYVVEFFGKHRQWWHQELYDQRKLNSYFDCGLMALKRSDIDVD